MKPFDIRKFAGQFEFNKGIIRNRKKAEDLIKLGYKPNRLLLHFVVDNDSLQFILAQIENDKIKYN